MAIKEISKELVEEVYEAIEVAKTTGKIRKGTNETTKAIERGIAKLVVVAKDVTPPEITMHMPLLAEEKEIPCVQVPSKEELGVTAGLGVGTASIAIVEAGEAKDLLQEVIKKIQST
ncbi:50S ribosomal protein L7ae [Candidatus Woesearchaeota archaeon]|nr:50S ribosomal protein L7ae [Candidatus Woesearchaeota archaeon]|tara:strand:+ start:8974 stop:9324 length:351 start_codon:yes stop_codon:yes gene_type:complete